MVKKIGSEFAMVLVIEEGHPNGMDFVVGIYKDQNGNRIPAPMFESHSSDISMHPNGWRVCGAPGPWNPITREPAWCFLRSGHPGYHMSRGLGRAPVDDNGNYDRTRGDG